jgi:hypothetical protein
MRSGGATRAMTNDQARMTKEAQSPNDELVYLDIRVSSFIRHSCLVIRHSCLCLLHNLCSSAQSASKKSRFTQLLK